MFVRRVITATRAATLLTGAQVNPSSTNPDAFLAFPPLRLLHGNTFIDDRINVLAIRFGHDAFSLFLQYAMHEGNRDRSFADGGCHTLNVTGTNVANGEDSRQTRFKEVWRTIE